MSIDLKKGNGFTLEKARTWRYYVWSITDADDADVISLLTNITTQTKPLLHSLEQGAGCIGLHVNADKTEYIQGVYDKFPNFFRMGNVIDSTHMKL